MRSLLVVVLAAALVACGGGAASSPSQTPIASDDTAAVQAAVDKGGVVTFAARTYHLTKTIVIRQSGTVIVGAGPATVFDFQPSEQLQHCVNDRVFTTPCALYDIAPRRVAAPINVGDTSFTAAAASDVADVHPGDWLLINTFDSVIGDRVAVDWVQVEGVSGLQVQVTQPFRMSFSTAFPWVSHKSGLGFEPIPLIENLELRNFKVVVDRIPSPNTGGLAIFGAMNTTIDSVSVENYNGQPLYCYLSKGVTFRNSQGTGGSVLSEFASCVDVTISGNHFSSTGGPGFGLDLGAGFFTVSDNSVDNSANAGVYLLYGVHDGTVSGNQIAQVGSTTGGNAIGLMIWGSQNIQVTQNSLSGGVGPQSVGISIRSYTGEGLEPDTGIVLSGNTLGAFVIPIQQQ